MQIGRLVKAFPRYKKSFSGELWGPAVGASGWSGPPGLLTLGSSPRTGSLSVVWCCWTEPVGLSPGKPSLSPLGAGSLV